MASLVIVFGDYRDRVLVSDINEQIGYKNSVSTSLYNTLVHAVR